MESLALISGACVKGLRFGCGFSYVGETSCVRAQQQRRHQHSTDVSSCHGDGYVRSVMSLVQAGADVSRVWLTFIKTFPSRRTSSKSQPITFQQMVVCEVLTQVENDTVLYSVNLATALYAIGCYMHIATYDALHCFFQLCTISPGS